MKQNEQQNRHGNDKESVSMKYSVADLMYVHCFRNRYRATKRLLATNPEAQLLCTGIMIVSDKYENGNYDIRTSMFGSVNNIINTLSDVLIERLKAGASPMFSAIPLFGSSCISFAAKRKISPMIRMIGGRIKISYLLPYRYLKIFLTDFPHTF